MSATYGPVIITNSGVIIPVAISSATKAMTIENQSLGDILVSVKPSRPNVVTQASAAASIAAGLPISGGDWDLHVGPRLSGTLQIPEDYLTDSAQGKYWTGTLWIQQVTMTNVAVTGGSFVSNPGPNVWVTAYGPSEQVPSTGLDSIGFFLASQERNVEIPPSAGQAFAGFPLLGSTGVFTTISNANIGNLPFSSPAITAGIASSGFIYVLLYSIHLSMWPLSAVAGTAESQHIQVRLAILDSASALVGGTGLVYTGYFNHMALQSMASDDYCPAFPRSVLTTVSVGSGPPYTVSPQMLVEAAVGGGGTNIKRMDVNLDYDVASAVPFGPGGGIAGQTQGFTYNGFVF